MPAHIDPVNGDCEELQSSCPWAQIGCPETKVCKYLDYFCYRRGSCFRGEVECSKMNGIDRFLCKVPPHVR